MAKTHYAIVEIEGGVAQAAYTDEETRLIVVDFDNLDDEPEKLKQVKAILKEVPWRKATEEELSQLEQIVGMF
jgi:hypothetical protein